MGHRADNKWVGHVFFGLGPYDPGASGMCSREAIFLLDFYASLREIASSIFYPCQKVCNLAVEIYDGHVRNQYYIL